MIDFARKKFLFLQKISRQSHRHCGAPMGSKLLKGGVIHLRRIVGLVGNGPEDHKGDTVAISGMGNGSAFHFRTQSAGFGNDGIFNTCF